MLLNRTWIIIAWKGSIVNDSISCFAQLRRPTYNLNKHKRENLFPCPSVNCLRLGGCDTNYYGNYANSYVWMQELRQGMT